MKIYLHYYICRTCGDYFPCVFTLTSELIKPPFHPEKCPMGHSKPKWEVESVEVIKTEEALE